jgi:hypothetical protein
MLRGAQVKARFEHIVVEALGVGEEYLMGM